MFALVREELKLSQQEPAVRGALCGCNQESWTGLYKRCLNKEDFFGFRCGSEED